MADKKQKNTNSNSQKLRTLASDLKRLEGDEESASENSSSGFSGNVIDDEAEEEVSKSTTSQKKKNSTEASGKQGESDILDELDTKDVDSSSKQKESSEISLLDDEVEESASKKEDDADNPLKDLERQKEKKKKSPSSEKASNVKQGVGIEKQAEDDAFYKNAWFIGSVVGLLLLIGGGGTYFYLTSSSEESEPVSSEEPRQNEDENTGDSSDNNQEPSGNVEGNQIISTDNSVQVSVGGGDTRSAVLNALSQGEGVWTEVVLVNADETRLPLEEVASELGITLYTPLQEQAVGYQLVSYNQEGVYKLGMIIQTSSENAPALVEEWSVNIPFDLSKFALETSSRTVVDPQINTRIVSQNGQSVTNYYYNYTDELNSIDVMGSGNLVLMSTSQAMQEALISESL